MVGRIGLCLFDKVDEIVFASDCHNYRSTKLPAISPIYLDADFLEAARPVFWFLLV
jgi:hypothetical protein